METNTAVTAALFHPYRDTANWYRYRANEVERELKRTKEKVQELEAELKRCEDAYREFSVK